jgi:hypothetical protein
MVNNFRIERCSVLGRTFVTFFCSSLVYCVRKRGADPLGVGVLRIQHLLTDE